MVCGLKTWRRSYEIIVGLLLFAIAATQASASDRRAGQLLLQNTDKLFIMESKDGTMSVCLQTSRGTHSIEKELSSKKMSDLKVKIKNSSGKQQARLRKRKQVLQNQLKAASKLCRSGTLVSSLARGSTCVQSDLDRDNSVNNSDLQILLSHFGERSKTGDLDGNGRVDINDLAILLSNIGCSDAIREPESSGSSSSSSDSSGSVSSSRSNTSSSTSSSIYSSQPSTPSTSSSSSSYSYSSAYSGSFVMPLGVPQDPSMIDLFTREAPALPSPWNANIPGFYYIRAGGSNTGNGFPGNPSRSIPDPIPAGSVIVFSGEFSSFINFRGTGTPEHPIFIRGLSETDRPTFYDDLTFRGSYIIIEHIKVAARSPNAAVPGEIEVLGDVGSHHIVLRHSEISGSLSDGDLQPRGDYIGIFNNYIHDKGDPSAAFDQDVHGITVPGQTSNLFIIDNDISHTSGNGIQVNAGGPTTLDSTHHIYIARNEIHDTRQPPLGIKQCRNLIVSQNTFHGARFCSACGSVEGYGAGWQYAPDNVWFLFNHIYDTHGGIIAGAADGGVASPHVYIIGNLIHDIVPFGTFSPNDSASQAGIKIIKGAARLEILGNTIHNAMNGIVLANDDVFQGYNANVFNNIVSDLQPNNANHLFIDNRDRLFQFSLGNNLLYQNGQSVVFRIGNAISNLPNANCPGCLNGNPSFFDLNGRDYRLTASSAARNTGSNAALTNVANTFQQLYGVSIDAALDGLRINEGTVDIGAYEFGNP